MKLFLNCITVALVLVISSTISVQALVIKKEQKFIEQVVGHKLVSGKSWILISQNGKITGKAGSGDKIIGAWVWNKKYWCRTVNVGQKKFPQDCQKISINGNTVTFTREKGKGKAIRYIIE